ncbi:MAG TPA: amidinotransferase [Flavobacteriales bacterium]|nr:amidinotransferase [Flavobacteriales bacterium]|tara:strand:- start:331 stop:1254 length:924 start_codon:yes stop_codon:yes gene_type:complete
MNPMAWNIQDEWQPLEAVVVGIGVDMGRAPALEDTYDPQSRKHVQQGTYPKQADVIRELDTFADTLAQRGIQVKRPESLGFNQVFTRDLGVVIDGDFVLASMVKDRTQEQAGIARLLEENMVKVHRPPEMVKLEGGDIMSVPGEIWVGCASAVDFGTYTTARTNRQAAEWLSTLFPNKEIRTFELHKSDRDAKRNALHLDCCLAPLGLGHLLVHPQGFKRPEQLSALLNHYDASHVYEITADEMERMQCNVFSIAPNTVASDQRFVQTNTILKNWGYDVIEIDLQETSKMGGLLRCATLPLRRTPIR